MDYRFNTISAIMIVKNEARCIKRAITSLTQAVNEIVIVDTGSEDNTVQIIESLAAKYRKIKLYHFEWCNDFSAARNFAIEKATSEWIFSVDADEQLHPQDRRALKEVIKKNRGEFIGLDVSLCNTKNGNIAEIVNKGVMRIFPRSRDLFFTGAIHERIGNPKLKRGFSNIRLLHDGYDSSAVDLLGKIQRNINLLNLELQKNPDDPICLMYLAADTASMGDTEKAREYFNRSRQFASADLLQYIEYYEDRLERIEQNK